MMDEDRAMRHDLVDVNDESSIDQNSVHEHEDALENRNLIVNYLPHDIDDLALKGLFVEFGEIVKTKVVTDRNTRKSLGFGFVEFLRKDDAKLAMERLNGFTIDNKKLKVSFSRPPSLEIKNSKLYVTNLPKDYTEAEVIGLFHEFGTIIECRVLLDRNNRPKGVAFVQFDNKAQATNALSLDGCQLEGGSRCLGVKFSEDQHKKREMSRLQNLTSHNVYRYMAPNGAGGSSGSGDGMDGGPKGPMRGGHDMVDSLTSGYYYSSSPGSGGNSPGMPATPHNHGGHLQHPHTLGQQHQQHPHVMHQLQQQQQQMSSPLQQQMSPLQHQLHMSPGMQHQQQMQHHSPVQQQISPLSHPVTHQSLNGMNAVFGNGSPLHQLQIAMVPPLLTSMHPTSPIMGSVSPNHFLFQQQQLLQQQAMGGGAGVSPRMYVYSPTGSMRRAVNKGRGAAGATGRGQSQYPSVDISQLTADPAPQQTQVQVQAQAQPQWYNGAGQAMGFMTNQGNPLPMQRPQMQQDMNQMGQMVNMQHAGHSGVSAQHDSMGMPIMQQQQQMYQQYQQGQNGGGQSGNMQHQHYQQHQQQHQQHQHQQHQQHHPHQQAYPQQASPQTSYHQQNQKTGYHQQQQHQSPAQAQMQNPRAAVPMPMPIPPAPVAGLTGHSPAQPHLQSHLQPSSHGGSHGGSQAGSQGPSPQLQNRSGPPTPQLSPVGPAPRELLVQGQSPHQQQHSPGGVTLVITNLPPHADVAYLHELVGPFGRVLGAQLDVDQSVTAGGGRVSVCAGRGCVQVMGMAQAESAVRAIHGSFSDGIQLQVSIVGSN